jgi:hypothetical protein
MFQHATGAVIRPDSASSGSLIFLLCLWIFAEWISGGGQRAGPSVASVSGFQGVSGPLGPGQDGVGRARMRARTSSSRWWSGGRRSSRPRAWRISRAGTQISR